MKLWKAHGLGNDYLVWEESAIALDACMVQKICHRTKGIGGDGILEPCSSSIAEYGVRIWNPDGSIAEKSGNGLRIFAYWLHAKRGAPGQFRMDTGHCVVGAEIQQDVISIDMGTAYWDPSEIPTCERVWGTVQKQGSTVLSLYAVGVGNPHCVVLFAADQSLDELPWRDWGMLLENDPRFPNRTNVQFAKVRTRGEIELRIWERGAGETSASGSSSCAVAAVAHRLGLVDSEIEMHMPGGILLVSIDDHGEIRLIGPVEEVGSCVVQSQFFEKFKKD